MGLTFNTSPNYLQLPSHWGLGLQYIHFEGTETAIILSNETIYDTKTGNNLCESQKH